MSLEYPPELVKIEHRYQKIRTAINLVAIILLAIVLYNLKFLADENHRLNEKQVAHLDCVAYLLTHYADKAKPITIKDLNNCKVNAKGSVVITALGPTKPSSISGGAPQPRSSVFVPSSPQQSAPATTKTQADNPQPPVKVLGIPACLPLTDICIRQ